MGAYLANFLQLLLVVLWVLIIGRVVASFVDPRGRHPLTMMVFQATEPILAPVRRLLPSTGMVDFSPMIVLLVLSAVVRAIA
jgi:YggT family protein